MKDKIQKEIEKRLDEVGIVISRKGYKYWITAIKYNIERDMDDDTITNVYIEVAKRHKTTVSRAERALRHAYEDIKDKIQEYFNVQYKVTNSVFLNCMTRLIVNCETGENVENASK